MTRSAEDIQYRGQRRWSGSYGKLWWDGLLLFEVEECEARVKVNREDVFVGTDIDTKMTSKSGEGSFKVKAVRNLNIARFLEAYNNGIDLRTNFVMLIDDPDAVDGQKERMSFGNVWLNELDLMTFKKGEVVGKTYNFGFTPSDVKVIEKIGD